MHILFALILSTLLLTAEKPTAMETVRAYASANHHAITERRDHGFIWIEMKDSDIFGVGRTEEEAAEDFLSCADLIEHEPADPAHAPAQWICPDKDYCI